MIQKIDQFHKTLAGYLLFGLVELGIAYGLVSLAIDRGSLIWYLLTLVFLIGALQNLFKAIGKVTRGHKSAKARRH